MWLSGCIVHRDLPAGGPEAEVKINDRPFPALLDSGSAVSLGKSCVPITCVHGDTWHVPVRRVNISAAPGTWQVEVGVVKDQLVPVLLGRNWPGFDHLLAAAIQPVSPRGSRRGKKPVKGARQCPGLLASDSGRDGESPQHRPNLFLDLYLLAPNCWPPWSGQHHPTDPWPIPLAGNGGWSQALLSVLPNLPENVTEDTSPQPAESAAHHRGALWGHRDGPSGAVAQVRPRPRTHPGHRWLCHPVPGSSIPLKGHRQVHRSSYSVAG